MKQYCCNKLQSESGRGKVITPMLITPWTEAVIAGFPFCNGASAGVPPSHLHRVNDGLGCGTSQGSSHKSLLHMQCFLLPPDGPLDLRMGHRVVGRTSGLEPSTHLDLLSTVLLLWASCRTADAHSCRHSSPPSQSCKS